MRTRPFTASALVTSMVLLVLVVSGGTSPTLAQAQPVAAATAGLREVAGPASVSDRARVGEPLRSSPVMFIENVGQFEEGARFQVWGGPGGTMWLAEDAIWITIVERSEVDPGERLDMEHPDARGAEELRRGVNLRLSFPGANPTPCLEPFDRLDTVVSYFIGNDPAQWRPAVPVWAGVRYRDLYPGVDLELTGEDGQWAWRWVPQSPGLPLPGEGSGAGDLLLRVEGADEVTVESGQLRLATAVGERVLPLPALEGLSLPQPAVARLGRGMFEVTAPVGAGSISPAVRPAASSEGVSLAYAGFLGGSVWDSGYGIAVDGAGNAYVTGLTYSSDFPAVVGPDLSFNGNEDAFVAKVRADGTGLVYVGFLGGSAREEGYGIAVDGAGNAYVTGWTNSSDFPVVVGPDLSYNGCYWEAFVAKVNAAGTGLVYAGFVGGLSNTRGQGIAVDGAGNAYVTGRTESSDFPAVVGPDLSFNGGLTDAFVAKVRADGTGLAYAGFLGGSSYDYGNSIAVDGAGNAYVAGWTSSNDFPALVGPDLSFNGNEDAFVAKVNAAGTGLVYAGFLGGSSSDEGQGIAVDGAGNAYVTGDTWSSDFPAVVGPDLSHNGIHDAFVAKVRADGTGLVYAGFLGGSDHDDGNSIAVDVAGNAYVTGDTRSSDFPAVVGPDLSYNGNQDAFVAKVNAAGTGLVYAGFLGGSAPEWGEGIAVDGAGNAYVTGETESNDFPAVLGPDLSRNGKGDAFVATVGAGGGPEPPDRLPVVLVHGWQGGGQETVRCSDGVSRPGPEVLNTFGDMAIWLDKDSFDVWIAHLDTGPGGTPLLEDNAWGPGCLKDQIAHVKQQTGAEQVILMAHSMGGLVSRAYIEGPEYDNDVQALFTLGSPHAGLPFNWLKYWPFGTKLDCEEQKALCQMTEGRMEGWNRMYGSISHGVTPLYYLIGGDKSDGSVLGRRLPKPNDGLVGTRSAQALKNDSPAIRSDVRGRYQTHESHSEGCCGYPSYFQPPFIDPTGDLRSQSYQCIQNVLLGTSNPCAGPSAAALSRQAVATGPGLTSYTSDVYGHLNTGETAEHPLQVDTDAASLFYLSWMTGTLGLTLTDPVGTVIDPAYAATHTDVVTYVTSSGSDMTPPFASYAFTTTVPGLYVARITAGGDVGTTGTDYLLFAAMETPRTLSVALDKDHYQIGDTATVTATLGESEGALATTRQPEIARGIPGATVQATFDRSDGITDTLILADEGDGTYRGTYVIPGAPGYLHLRVTAEGSDGGTPFNRQVDRLRTVASQAVQLTGTYGDRAQDTDGDGRYEALIVDVEVLALASDFSFSANLVDGGGEFIAHTISQTTLIEGTQSVPLRFDGDLIHDRGRDGPFTVTDLLIGDLQNVGIPSVIADDVWTTVAYDHTEFGRITGDVDGNCVVDVVDIMLVADRWRATIGDGNYNQLYDQGRDGDIDIVDIMLVAANWGSRCGDGVSGTESAAGSEADARPESPPATLQLEPVVSMVAPSATFTVAVEIEGAVDLGGFQLAMNFDPAVVHVDNVALGNFLGSTGRSTVPLGPEINNDAGTVAFGGFSFGGQAGPNGDGVLATIVLTAEATGISPVTLEKVQLADTLGRAQTVTIEDGRVIVSGSRHIYLPLVGEEAGP